MKKNKAQTNAPPVYIEWNQGSRNYQEDFYGVVSQPQRPSHPARVLAVVADGMGGHTRGDLVSRWTIEKMVAAFEKYNDINEILFNGVSDTIEQVKASGKDMGGTVVAAIIEKTSQKEKKEPEEKETGPYRLTYTWVGDSRIYLVTPTLRDESWKPCDNAKEISRKGDATLWLLTDDDSFVWDFFLNGELTIDEVTQHPNKNQLECTIHSSQEMVPDTALKRIRTVYLQENDRVFLCTDGIWETYEHQAGLLHDLDSPDPHASILEHLDDAMQRDPYDFGFSDNGTFIITTVGEELFKTKRYDLPGKTCRFRLHPFFIGLLALLVFVIIFLLVSGRIL